MMVDCAGEYYGEAFQVFQGLPQGNPLSLTIYIVVVDVVVIHWV